MFKILGKAIKLPISLAQRGIKAFFGQIKSRTNNRNCGKKMRK